MSVASTEQVSGALVELLRDRILSDSRIGALFVSTDAQAEKEFTSALQRFLSSAHVAIGVQAQSIDQQQLAGPLGSVVDALVDVVHQPLPLGEDIRVAAMDILADRQQDVRIISFFEHLHALMLPKISPSIEGHLQQQSVKSRKAGQGKSKSRTKGSAARRVSSEPPPQLEEGLGEFGLAGAQLGRSLLGLDNQLSTGGSNLLGIDPTAMELPELRLSPAEIREIQLSWAMLCAKKGSVEAAEATVSNKLKQTDSSFAQILYGADSAIAGIDRRTGLRKRRNQTVDSKTGRLNSDTEITDMRLIDKAINGSQQRAGGSDDQALLALGQAAWAQGTRGKPRNAAPASKLVQL